MNRDADTSVEPRTRSPSAGSAYLRGLAFVAVVVLIVFIIDSLADAFIFHQGSLVDSLLLRQPSHQVFDRLVLTMTLGIFAGTISIARSWEKQAKQNMRRSLEESTKRQKEVSALFEGARAVLERPEFTDAAQEIFSSCRNIIGATSGYVATMSEDGTQNIVQLLDTGGRPCTVDRTLPMPIRGLREEAYRSRMPAFENDFSKSKWATLMPQGHVALHNVLFVPMMIKEKPIGLLGFGDKPGGFTENDARLATAFADLAAVALQTSLTRNELANAREYLEKVFASVTDFIFVTDADRRIVTSNAAIERAFGYTKDEVTGKSTETFYPSREAFEGASRTWIEQIKKRGYAEGEITLRRKDGSLFPAYVAAARMVASDGKLMGIVVSGRDISDQKKIEEMKDRVISAITHELRTPLASIKAYTDIVLAGPVPKEIASDIEVVKRNTDRLLHLTDDLLDIRRMESGKLTLELTQLDMREIIDRCANEIAPLMEQRNQSFRLEVPEETVPVRGDPIRLTQVVMNLLNNAVKFAPESGNVVLSVRDAKDHIQIRVSDTGIGIRKEDLERVFEPFAAIEKPTYIKGTGLGLSVTKGLVEAHGGRIWAESEGEGKGATFTFTLPKQMETE